MAVSTPRGDVAMVYSGEVYNFTELRDELATGGPPVRHVQRHRGRAARLPAVGRGGRRPAQRHVRLRHLGLAATQAGAGPRPDGHQAALLLPTPDGVLFGSEPKAILANPLAEPRGRRRRAARAARLRQDARARDLARACARSSPGTIVTGRRARVCASARYWWLEAHAHTDDLDTTVAHVRELLDDIVAPPARRRRAACACCCPAAWTPVPSPRSAGHAN